MNERASTEEVAARAEFTAEIAARDIQSAVLRREIEKQAGLIRKLNGETAAKSKECASLKSRVASCNAEMEKMQKSLSAAQDRFLDEIKEAQAGLRRLEAKREEVAADNVRLVAEKARLEEALAAAQKGNDGLAARLESMGARKEEAVADNARLASENSRLSKELAAAKGRIDELSTALSSAQRDSAMFKAKADGRYSEILGLNARLKEAQAAAAEASDKAETVGRQLVAANAALRECREREDARGFSKCLHRFAKGVMPYGFTCMWKRMAYGIAEDKPLFYYPGFFRRTMRVVKFSLPYFVVAAFRRNRRDKDKR